MAIARPELVQFGALTAAHFVAHPVWIACHIADYGEPWYEETDEETFRPWSGAVPVGCHEMYLVACTFRLADGSLFSGFATPADASASLGAMQPQIFDATGTRHAFWLGMFPDNGAVERFRRAMSKSSSSVFPLTFQSLSNLTTARCSGTIHGFMKSSDVHGEVLQHTW